MKRVETGLDTEKQEEEEEEGGGIEEVNTLIDGVSHCSPGHRP